jgi:hypothetical protein
MKLTERNALIAPRRQRLPREMVSVSPSPRPKRSSGAPKVERKIRNIELTDQEYYDFARIAGRLAKMRRDVFALPIGRLGPRTCGTM